MARIRGVMRWGLFAFGGVALLSGCHHRTVVPTLPPVLPAAQEPQTPPPAPQSPEMHGPPPEGVSTAPVVKVTPAKRKHAVKKVVPKGTVASTPAADTDKGSAPPAAAPVPGPPTAAAAIGELSAGGDASQKTGADAAGLIASTEHALDALPEATANQQQAQIRNVRLFLKQAHQALSSGDAAGANTLATKAKLLLDDITK